MAYYDECAIDDASYFSGPIGYESTTQLAINSSMVADAIVDVFFDDGTIISTGNRLDSLLPLRHSTYSLIEHFTPPRSIISTSRSQRHNKIRDFPGVRRYY